MKCGEAMKKKIKTAPNITLPLQPGKCPEKEYKVLFDKTPCYVSVIDREFRILKANSKFRKTFGNPAGAFCYQIYKKADTACESCPAREVFSTGREHSSTQAGLDMNGNEKHYMVTAAPLEISPGGEVQTVMEIAVDVTRIHELEVEKLEMERLAAVGQTVAGLAHGIKNIITGLEGGFYVMKTGLKNSQVERIAKGLDMLDGNIARISKFIKEFLSFARGKKPEITIIDPVIPAKDVISMYTAAAAGSGVKLSSELSTLPSAPLDTEGIHTCLANLVSNAIDACIMSRSERPEVEVRLFERNGDIIYEVADNGVGMDCEIKKKIFTSFFSTKKTGEGTGIGLLMTKKIAMEHGGSVEFETAPGRGATFRLVLPRARLPKPSPAGVPHSNEKHQTA